MGERITDELRKKISKPTLLLDLEDIADRIDEAHRKALDARDMEWISVFEMTGTATRRLAALGLDTKTVDGWLAVPAQLASTGFTLDEVMGLCRLKTQYNYDFATRLENSVELPKDSEGNVLRARSGSYVKTPEGITGTWSLEHGDGVWFVRARTAKNGVVEDYYRFCPYCGREVDDGSL